MTTFPFSSIHHSERRFKIVLRTASTQTGLGIRSVKHLALRLRLRDTTLTTMAENVDANPSRFFTRRVIKTGHKSRVIFSPSAALKRVQSRINRCLLQTIPLSPAVHSYTRGKSAVTCAERHVCRDCVLKIDIKDFFPSIHYREVYRLFQSLGCSPDVARVLTRLTTCKGHLAQGFSTSPSLSNLFLRETDRRIQRCCDIHKLTYSRYGDDIVISGGRHVEKVKQTILRILRQRGLAANEQKTKLMSSRKRQEMLGLIVNRKVNIPRDVRRQLRAELDRYRKQGIPCGVPEAKLKKTLLGKISYIGRINPTHGARLAELLKEIAWSVKT